MIEMFNVLVERFPKFNETKAEEYVKRPTETLLHGDFHSGNVMIGEGENKGIFLLSTSASEKIFES